MGDIVVIGDNLKSIRASKGIGVNELSRRSGVNASYISAIERNEKNNPSPKILSKLAEALEIPVDDFFKEDSKQLDEIDQLEEDIKALFKKIKNMSPSDRDKILKLIEIFEQENHD
jgi:transcriptional regulator with XRE-family HTH domain